MDFIQREIADEAYSVWATLTLADEGACVFVGGGHSHVGTVMLALPRESLLHDGSVSCTTSVINVSGHKDDIAVLPLAEQICREFNIPVTVTAGIHIGEASSADIVRFRQNTSRLTQLLCDALHEKEDKA